MRVGVISHPDCLKHEMGYGHPECPERLESINRAIDSSNIASKLHKFEAPLASSEQLQRTHLPQYVDEVFTCAPKDGYYPLDTDAVMNAHTLDAARRAAGAVVHAVDLVMSNKMDAILCNVRPPGHHATYRQAMGFCFFNNIAVGVRHAQEAYQIKRVAIIDFDVHHGNGTEDIFANDPGVMVCSSFQHPHYPYSGADTVSDHILNLPLPANSDGAYFRNAVESNWVAKLTEFQPDIIFFSAGFDSHRDDPLGRLNLVEDDFAWISRVAIDVFRRNNRPVRIVSSLEGGYHLQALARGVLAHLTVFVEAE